MPRKNNVNDESVLFFDQFEEWLDFNRYEWGLSTYLTRRYIGLVFREFEKKYQTKMQLPYDKKQYLKFYRYCMDVKKVKMSTLGKYSKVIRAVIRFHDPNADYSFLKTGDYPPSVHALKKEELELWINALVESGWRVKTRDLFSLSALTGMRFSDTQEQDLFQCLEGKILRYYSVKTGIEAVVPVRRELLQILERHNYKFTITNQAFNKQLKELAKELGLDRMINGEPLWKQMRSHIGRKTFITNAVRDKVPIPYVMKMAGLTNYNTMKRYLVVNEEDILNATDMWFDDDE